MRLRIAVALALAATYGAAVAAVAVPRAPVGGSPTAVAKTPTKPAPITALVHKVGGKEGDFFVAPQGLESQYADGPEIVDGKGRQVWFKQLPAGSVAHDFHPQLYRGKEVLTWWQSTNALGALPDGNDIIANRNGKTLMTVNAGNDEDTDGHEFLITPQNTALITAHYTTTVDLTSIGGPADQLVTDGVVQEVNIKTGKVLLDWNSADHVPYSDSEVPIPASPSTRWDWFHVNAAHLDTDGSILIGGRNTWATYDVNRTSGAVNWILGGKSSSFTESAATGQRLDDAGYIFSWQHDPVGLGHHTYTFFDDDSDGVTPQLKFSREVTVKLHPNQGTAVLVSSDKQPNRLSAGRDGSAQTLPDGNVVVGWGSLPYFSEFSATGKLLDNFQLPAGAYNYRVYRAPWPPAPKKNKRK